MNSLKNTCNSLIINNYKSYKINLWLLPNDLRYIINKKIFEKNKFIKKYEYY